MFSNPLSRTIFGAVAGSALITTLAFAQKAPSSTPSPAPSTGPSTQSPSTPSPGRGGNQGQTGNPFPGQQQQQDRMQFPEMQRTFFFSGKVILDDGTPPPDSVVIERVCNGIARPEAYTDSKGKFSFQLGQNTAMMADASTSSADSGFGGLGGGGRGGMAPGMGGRQITERDLMGCELRASLAGFRSDVVSLAGRRSLDNPEIGTIVLHRLAKVDGFTFSATSAYAPKDARKAYEKGKELNKKNKLDAAEKELLKATSAYPKYAAAWYELGVVYHQQSKIDEARKAYEQSTKADEKYITPYAQLARLAAAQQKWDDTIAYSEKVIRLNPFFSSEIYFLNSVANLNNHKLQEAEENAREAAKMDVNHKNPRIAALLGVVLAQKGDLTAAAEQMRAYLKMAPTAPDADRVREQLAQIEKQTASQATPKDAP